MNLEELKSMAWEFRDRAYAPYSGFKVGAVVIDSQQRPFGGANVENLSYGLTQCAERVAMGSAVAAGARQILCVVIVADTDLPISPCGACRQVMAEFGNPDVWMVNRTQELHRKLADLLPRAQEGILNRNHMGDI